MTIDIFMEFNVTKDAYSDFILAYYNKILEKVKRHKGLGVIGPEATGVEWKWTCVRITNEDKSIDVVTHLDSLYVYGIRRVLPEGAFNPWWLLKGHKKIDGFSGLVGDNRTLEFGGAYRNYVYEQSLSWISFKNAIYELDEFAENLNKREISKLTENNEVANSDELIDNAKAEKNFLLMVLYLAEALKILPIRNQIIDGFDFHKDPTPGRYITLAKNWETLSEAFFSNDYTDVGMHCKDEAEAKLILGLLRFAKKKDHELDNSLLNDRPENPGALAP